MPMENVLYFAGQHLFTDSKVGSPIHPGCSKVMDVFFGFALKNSGRGLKKTGWGLKKTGYPTLNCLNTTCLNGISLYQAFWTVVGNCSPVRICSRFQRQMHSEKNCKTYGNAKWQAGG